MLTCPVPCVLQKLVTGKVCLLNSFLSKSVYDFSFCRDRGMVGARNPASVLSFHSCAAHKNVLYGIIEHVPHVEHACDIDRKSTRLNSSHANISYAVFCL